MEKLIIEGNVPLQGEIEVSGSKNAALPILMASILVDGPVTFKNVPRLRDIHTTLKLLGILGCAAAFTLPANHTVAMEPGNLSPEAPYDLVKTMRASVLCLGPLLARLGQAKVALPGGCAIGARPVNLHLTALEKMGAKFTLEDGYIYGACSGLKGAHISFDFPTVGGTENLLMAAALAEGETILENAAREPEVVDLANFLIACGARIEGAGSGLIAVQGVPSLRGCTYSIMPDRIEAGTFVLAGAITNGDILVKNCPCAELEALFIKLKDMGIILEENNGAVRVRRNGELLATDVTTQPYPGFPTDMQAQVMALMTLAKGAGVMKETIFENRFMHVPELNRMGADISLSGHTALVRGVKELKSAPVMASDLRASASLVLAGLAAKGKTEVQRIYHLDRGYEQIEQKLIPLGARIKRVNG